MDIDPTSPPGCRAKRHARPQTLAEAAVQMNGEEYAMEEEKLSPKQREYRKFFDSALKKFGASSPAKMDDSKKKKFFDYVKANWKG